jgi:hypothetical protein
MRSSDTELAEAVLTTALALIGAPMKWKTRVVHGTVALVGISSIAALAQNQSDHSQTGHREIVVATNSSWNGTAYTITPLAKRNLRRSGLSSHRIRFYRGIRIRFPTRCMCFQTR